MGRGESAMIKTLSRTALRKKRHLRFKKKVLGDKERPRVSVFRSCVNLYLQLVDDTEGVILCSASTLSKEFKEKGLKSCKNVAAARAVAELFSQKLRDKGIQHIVFDRSGYRFHGKVKAMADVLREKGFLS
jgi:large subunit ribosomal protein L18